MTATLTLLGKPDCHLCHDMADVVRRVVEGRVALAFEDVRTRPEWQAYRREIPVLLWGEREIVRHRVSETELKEKLVSLGLPL